MIFFIEEYKKGRPTFIIEIFFELGFLMYFVTKNEPKFRPSIPNRSKSLEHFFGRFHRTLVLLIHH